MVFVVGLLDFCVAAFGKSENAASLMTAAHKNPDERASEPSSHSLLFFDFHRRGVRDGFSRGVSVVLDDTY